MNNVRLNKSILNYNIRKDIEDLIREERKWNTRSLIKEVAIMNNTSKQRVSGNISFVAHRLNKYTIVTKIPNKESYIY